VLILNGDQFPVPAANLEEANAVGVPLPVNRDAAAANRQGALNGLQTIPGYDLDEAPPAMFRNPGDTVIVRPTPPAQNRGAGASLGNQARGQYQWRTGDHHNKTEHSRRNTMSAHLTQLLSVASETLAEPPNTHAINAVISANPGSTANELCALLADKNGFFAFESALLVRPLDYQREPLGILQWNRPELGNVNIKCA